MNTLINIETSNLILVPVSEVHIKEIFENFNEQIVTYMEPQVVKNIDEIYKIVKGFIEGRENNTDYVYAITLKSSGEFIGIVSLHNLKNESPELGIWIKISYHGNHYGREAIGGVIDYAQSLGVKKLCYPVDRRNISSKKIPLFYGGKLVTEYKKVETSDGRILEEEIYEILI
ncbi:GNAT family N-acetyltransferase [Clostridium lundense]|uniref:GNAT family N-acetyltransferase n=1 Tax=Clostridium lundense TaxID=319475 RepID=UPI0006851AF6|nr:GNAT family N-acetyltransferase [Clostridium lundense]